MLSLCARRDVNALTEACVADTDFTSLGGLALQTASFAILGASRQSQQVLSVWGQPESDSICNSFGGFKMFFSNIRTEVRAAEHFTGENFVKEIAFMISFLPSDGAV